ncbi:hypothetical protein MMC08_004812 [Hypocenomyce scalaris]|nr:hypothetical protein [Hypocenomyce scalaris]
METYNGHVRTPADAIILFEACRQGLLPRVQRRLSEKERQSIKSGSVFVWDEREAGMRRWTDGKSWSASRVSGSFLTYREMEGKRGGNGFAPPLAATRAGKTPDSTRGSDEDLEMAGEDGPDGYRYKPDGLMKQSFSITTSQGNHLHLISYYARSHPTAQGLNQPTTDPALRHIRPQKGMYPETTVHEQQNIPAVTRSPMVNAPYAQAPHMAGYARGSPHPISYAQPGYGWPSPPMSTVANGYPYHYGQGSLPPPPGPLTNGHSPLAYGQTMPLPVSQPPLPTAYDRPPAPLADSSLPPPPPPPHHRGIGPMNGTPLYAPNPSPRVAQSTMIAQQHHSRPQNSSTPPISQIDPRLMAPSPLVQQQQQQKPLQNSEQTRTPPRTSEARQENQDAQPPREMGTSQASSIPSIGAIMNGSSNDNADARSDRSARSSSRSPGGTKKAEGPKDIPSEKLGFGEDMRALRVLDRAFKT